MHASMRLFMYMCPIKFKNWIKSLESSMRRFIGLQTPDMLESLGQQCSSAKRLRIGISNINLTQMSFYVVLIWQYPRTKDMDGEVRQLVPIPNLRFMDVHGIIPWCSDRDLTTRVQYALPQLLLGLVDSGRVESPTWILGGHSEEWLEPGPTSFPSSLVHCEHLEKSS